MEAIQMINLTPEHLTGLLIDGLKTQLGELKKWLTPSQSDLLTREEVAEMLKINLSTLHNWTKQGKLISYGVGGRVYYKRAEIEKALVRIE